MQTALAIVLTLASFALVIGGLLWLLKIFLELMGLFLKFLWNEPILPPEKKKARK